MSSSTMQEHISILIHGLNNRGIDFVVSDAALGCSLTEVYITQAQELILFPQNRIDTPTLQLILEVRTPLKVRLTFFSHDVPSFKANLTRAISAVQDNGLEIPNIENTIFVHELTEHNIYRLLDSLENYATLRTNDTSRPPLQSALPSQRESVAHSPAALENFHLHLRRAIKTYWTERYFARYLNTPIENMKKIASRLGIQQETCGQETLYFFDRAKALRTYFSHIIKGILAELNLQYRETLTQGFYVLDLKLGIYFFDGEIDQLRILAGEYKNNHELIIVVPEALRRKIGQIQERFFQVLPLNQDKIKTLLIRTIQQRIQYLPAHSSGIK
ncbi:MAG: hypothetical protein ACFE89_08000 [Candidatus Hodarchaeota archaeon]